ncbi:MAG: hypothetical protein JSW65_00760 [Candidatus Bipolaricaulota bacterium]|nr:MAG: hypothetical protein JSW65_00760 [Candidatus Bipolaricaulota bacterium]
MSYHREASYPVLRSFRWKARRFVVSTIDLVYPERRGETQILCYFVSCGRKQFQLRLDTGRHRWSIRAGVP